MKEKMTRKLLIAVSLMVSCCHVFPQSIQAPPDLPQANSRSRLRPIRDLLKPGAPAEAQRHASNNARFKRSKAVAINSDWLPRRGETIHAALFEDARLEITVGKTISQSGGLFTTGHIVGHPEFVAYFASYGGSVSAHIQSSDGRTFSVFPSPEGNHIVAENDSGFSICDTLAEQAPESTNSGQTTVSTSTMTPETRAADGASDEGFSASAASLPSGNAVIDIMVMYSPEAKAAYGGDAGIRSIIILQFGYFNETLLNSGCAVEGRLVYSAETTWHNQLSSAQADWNWIQGDINTLLLRDTYGADLVPYLTTHSLGFGWPLHSYSIVNNSTFVFTHELGHNLGCHHNVEQDGPGFYPPYSYGYHVTIDNIPWGTIMSYIGVLRIAVFSNPDVYWMGVPLGNATSADNHRVINENAPIIASWRTTQIALLQNPRFLNATNFAINLTGATSQAGTYTVEYTADYASWTSLGSFAFSGGTLSVTDSSVTSSTPQRFYRAMRGTAIVGSQVGFVRKIIPSGDSMVGNQLDSGDNRLSALWPVAGGIIVYKWDAGRQQYLVNGFNLGEWDDPNMSLGPGEGAIVRNYGAATTLTFVGHVWQGFQIQLGTQWQIVSSPAPQAGLVTSVLNFPMLPGAGSSQDKITRMTGNGVYTDYLSTGSTWTPFQPTIGLGEAFWCYKHGYYYVGNESQNYWSRVFWTWP